MPNTSYCKFIQNNLGHLDECQDIDKAMREKVTETFQPLSYVCHAGLREIIAPVVIGGRLAGFFDGRAVPDC